MPTNNSDRRASPLLFQEFILLKLEKGVNYPGGIAEMLGAGVNRSSVSIRLRECEKKGFVKEVPPPTPQSAGIRKTFYQLTKQGSSHLSDVLQEFETVAEQMGYFHKSRLEEAAKDAGYVLKKNSPRI